MRIPPLATCVETIAFFLGALSSGCRTSSSPFLLEITWADGRAPIEGEQRGRLELDLIQEGTDRIHLVIEAPSPGFEGDIPIPSLFLPTRVFARMKAGNASAMGALPPFIPGTLPKARLLLVEEGRCMSVSPSGLTFQHFGGAMLIAEAQGVVAGGVGEEGNPSDLIERFIPQLLGTSRSQAISLRTPSPLSTATLFRFAKTPKLLLKDSARIFLVDLQSDQISPILLPFDLGSNSSIGGFGDHAVIVNDLPSTSGSGTMIWINQKGEYRSIEVPAPRPRTAIGALAQGGGFVLAGGNPPGHELFLHISIGPTGHLSISAFGDRIQRQGGALFPSPSRRTFFFVGSFVEDGEPDSTTWIVRGCPERCSAEIGPPWPHPRRHPAFVSTPTHGWVIGGEEKNEASDRVERIEWNDEDPQFVESRLANPRIFPLAAHFEGGLVLLCCGKNTSGLRKDFELCAPSALAMETDLVQK
ncbi:MAG: hypothetical protein RMJ84_07515 [Sandaracinaceae bacterium]|nr:hypothetical protein [Sandaracinaceae bacterium]